jgi:hypothetical protein
LGAIFLLTDKFEAEAKITKSIKLDIENAFAHTRFVRADFQHAAGLCFPRSVFG